MRLIRKTTIIVSFMTLFQISSYAQPYVEGGNTRHRFAQTTVGTSWQYFSNRGTGILSNPLLPASQANLVIGGTHFWGHADFIVSIPVYRVHKSNYLSGVETGFRAYPWRIEDNKVRPFVGGSWNPASFQKGEGSRLSWHEFPLSAGITYNIKNVLVDFVVAYHPSRQKDYYLQENEAVKIQTHKYRFNIGLKWMFDSTLSAEEQWKNGKTAWMTDTLEKLGRLNGWTIGIGPSSSMFLKSSNHNEVLGAQWHQHKSNRVFPEFGLGYYFHRHDLQLNLAYRNIKSEQVAFGQSQNAKRQSTTLEMFKFFSDYHGFAPFIGPSISMERLSLSESNQSEKYKATLYRPGITFGWDIRPNRIQSFYLRTNLRWIPGLKLQTKDQLHFHFDQLEFNFIQLVIFPGRMF